MVKKQKSSWLGRAETEYLQALRLYWQNEKEGALSLITDRLAEDAVDQAANYYRLWMEVLAEDNDESSLRILQEHIRNQIDFKDPSWIDLYALTGLIHYELGELEAAHILQKKLLRHSTNAYAQELYLILSPNLEIEQEITQASSMLQRTNDYFLLKRAALIGFRCKKSILIKNALSAIQTHIGKSPLSAEIGFHKQFSARDFKKAWQYAKVLRDEFSLNTHFQFYFAYTSYLIDKNKTALEEFIKLSRRHQDEDPDVLCMIGVCLLGPGRKPLSKDAKRQSINYLERTRHRLQTQGLPTDYPQELIFRLQDKVETPKSGKNWIVKLSPRQCHDLYQYSLDRIEYLHRTMGQYVKAGDTCLFVSESRIADKNEPGIWRLVAIYKALSDPEWHPTHRWQTILKLQIRMEVSVPLEIEGNRSLRRIERGAQRFGLHEIDESALAWIEDSVKNYTLDDKTYNQVFEELKLARSV